MSYPPRAPLSFHFSELLAVIVITDTVKEQKSSPQAICRYFLSQQMTSRYEDFFDAMKDLLKMALSFGSPSKENDAGRGILHLQSFILFIYWHEAVALQPDARAGPR